MKTYKATVTQQVLMTKAEYKAYLREKQGMYVRLIKAKDEELAGYKKRLNKKIDEYEAKIKEIEDEIRGL